MNDSQKQIELLEILLEELKVSNDLKILELMLKYNADVSMFFGKFFEQDGREAELVPLADLAHDLINEARKRPL
ncbi:hypothetical protein ACHJH3_08580 [Campylobacter sp. MOP7]|uniref:hypothetical protein n=1 Tax=Campylobacter canis TaxID=3378588 RepID=UPI00387E7F88